MQVPGLTGSDPASLSPAAYALLRSGGYGGPAFNGIVYTDEAPDESNDFNIFVRTSTNDGANWSAMAQIGGGGGATDQFEPNVAVNDTGDVAVVWYDRRNDVANNTNIDVYTAFSADGGTTFQPIVRVTDVSFGVPQLLPNFNPGAAQCYMGEYIAVAGDAHNFYYLWGDNRNTVTSAAWPAPGRRAPSPGPTRRRPSSPRAAKRPESWSRRRSSEWPSRSARCWP